MVPSFPRHRLDFRDRDGGQLLLAVPMFILAALGPTGIHIAKFLPMIILANSVTVVAPVPGCLSAWAGIGVLCLYAAIALGIGGWLFARRDA